MASRVDCCGCDISDIISDNCQASWFALLHLPCKAVRHGMPLHCGASLVAASVMMTMNWCVRPSSSSDVMDGIVMAKWTDMDARPCHRIQVACVTAMLHCSCT